MFSLGNCTLGNTAFNIVQNNFDNKKKSKQEKGSNKHAACLARVAAAKIICWKGKLVRDLKATELKILLDPLKRKDDGEIPHQEVA